MEKITKTVLCASVAGREQQLKVAIRSIYNQVDEIHLVLNFYLEVPAWINKLTKVYTYLNPTNKNAHDAIWFRVIGLESVDKMKNDCAGRLDYSGSRYYFTIDDDLLYPDDYISVMVEGIERHERRAVITAHGANIVRPVKDYFECRHTYIFSDRLERDIFVDMAGVGCSAWHSSTISPTPNDFPIPFCRDLWFAIKAKRDDVPLVCLRRPTSWILPLKTEGETVYELTRSNEKLKALKNRILKEQLLPLLAFGNNCKDYVLMTDYDFDERLVANSLATLSNVCVSNNIIFTNKPKIYSSGAPLTQFVTDEERAIGIAGSKIITHHRFISGLPTGSQVISADLDLHYLDNPFTAFEQDFDIAVTTRGYLYHYPINQGVVMYRVNDRVRDFLSFLSAEIYERTWPELIEWQKRFNHVGNDWSIGQDMMCVSWLYKNLIKDRFGVNIIDVGPRWNFCPHADGIATKEGKRQLMEAYNNKSAIILHLKSRLKELLFDGMLK